MANDNNKINELADDTAATAELELITARREDDASFTEAEADADTCAFGTEATRPPTSIRQLQSDLRSRNETINRLQYDIEQLRSRWVGLETEIGARQELTDRLNAEIDEFRDRLKRKEKLLRERDESIRGLKAEIRERHEETQSLIEENARVLQALESQRTSMGELLDVDDTGKFQKRLAEQAGRLASEEARVRELSEKFIRAERYGDVLRRQLQEQSELADEAVRDRDNLLERLEQKTKETEKLGAAVTELREENAALGQKLAGIESAHADEIRKIRFELGEAQETISQQDLINEQLTSDLVQTKGSKADLETMLDRSDRESRERIEKLETRIQRLQEDKQELAEQLASKNDAVKMLLAELASKSQQIEQISELEDVIQDIDKRMSGSIPARPASERDRVTRVLIGSVEGQELRFPLFKDKLTIGRTEQNDIQLKAPYISRRHAVVVTEGDITRVIDWGSKNGVFVNSSRVSEHFLRNGDIVAIGLAKFRYEERPKRDNA